MSNWYAEDFDDRGNNTTQKNPFAAGDAWQEHESSEALVINESDFRLDGNELVVTSGASMPPICIKTGRTTQLNPVKVTLSHSPAWAFVVGGVLLAVLFQKKCDVTYFVNKEVAALHRKRRIIGVLGIILGITLVLGAAVAELPALAIVAAVVIIGAIVFLARSSLGLAISRHENGIRFWIKGFDRNFLERLERAEIQN